MMSIFGMKRVVIGDGERGLLYRNRRFERVLAPGVTWLRAKPADLRVVDITRPEYDGKDVEILISRLGAELERDFLLADIGSDEVGLLSKNGKLEDVLPPGSRKLYWKGPVAVDVQRLQPGENLEVEPAVAKRLRQARALEMHTVSTTVPTESAGLLFVDGKLVRVLQPGAYAFWNFQRNVGVELVELRLQSLEVSGQELLTRDKVSLRVNLSATIRVIDPVAARTKVAKYADHLYRELQFGLRAAVGTRSLDELLENKTVIDEVVTAQVKAKLADYGLQLDGVGVKDIVLPGEMKTILAQVVEAEKSAQANVIRRREETAATRSLLNTAKVMEGNPVALRMKELETLERVAERIDKISVFGGLDQVLNGLVKLR